MIATAAMTRRRAPARALARFGVVLVLATPYPQAASAADTLPPPSVEVGVTDDDFSRPADGRVSTPAASAGVSADSTGTADADGPTVELITGGKSKDGAARVGRLPVLD